MKRVSILLLLLVAAGCENEDAKASTPESKPAEAEAVGEAAAEGGKPDGPGVAGILERVANGGKPSPEAAVEALGKLADDVCDCKDGPDCKTKLTPKVDEWVAKYSRIRSGGDMKKAEEHVMRIAKCNPEVAMHLASTASG